MKKFSATDPAYQKNVDTTHDLFSTIRALDAGIANHELWISEVHQSLICGNPHSNHDDLCDDAHCRCKFGQWIYGADVGDIKELEHFHFVIDKHLQMHDLARNILVKSEADRSITENEYKEFISLATGFKLDVRNLQYELMSQVCIVDHLTGAWNRYAMYSALHQEKERQMRTGSSCTICMMDVDHFKQINDTYGHSVGDQVLKSVVEFCRVSLRKYDSIYRYGGEEFLFCLPDADLDKTRTVIERLCDSLGTHRISLANGENVSVTASFGIAGLQKNASVEESIQAADHALLCAKSKGRDRVCYWEDDPDNFK